MDGIRIPDPKHISGVRLLALQFLIAVALWHRTPERGSPHGRPSAPTLLLCSFTLSISSYDYDTNTYMH
jgi:hypothetical protein